MAAQAGDYVPKRILVTGGAGFIGANAFFSPIFEENREEFSNSMLVTLWRAFFLFSFFRLIFGRLAVLINFFCSEPRLQPSHKEVSGLPHRVFGHFG